MQNQHSAPSWLWLWSLSALVHAVLTCSSLYSLQLRYHFHLGPVEIGQSLLCAYLALTVTPFLVLRLKSGQGNLWRTTAGLSLFLGVLLLSFGFLPSAYGAWALALHALLIVTASLVGSLFRSNAQQALNPVNRERNYLFLMWVAALAFGLVALGNGFWLGDDLRPAFAGFALGATLVAVLLWRLGGTKSQPTLGFSRQTLGLFWRRPELGFWLMLCALAVAASNSGDMYMAYLLREELGADPGHVSWAWAIGVLTELPLYFLSMWWTARYSLRSLLQIALAGIALRMALLAVAPNLSVFFVAQALDGFYSGVLLAAFPLWLGRFVNDRRLPMLLLMAGVVYLGLGRAVGGYVSGWIWELWGLRALFGTWALLMIGVFLLALGARWFFPRGLHSPKVFENGEVENAKTQSKAKGGLE
jgi:hypothetical protein